MFSLDHRYRRNAPSIKNMAGFLVFKDMPQDAKPAEAPKASESAPEKVTVAKEARRGIFRSLLVDPVRGTLKTAAALAWAPVSITGRTFLKAPLEGLKGASKTLWHGSMGAFGMVKGAFGTVLGPLGKILRGKFKEARGSFSENLTSIYTSAAERASLAKAAIVEHTRSAITEGILGGYLLTGKRVENGIKTAFLGSA